MLTDASIPTIFLPELEELPIYTMASKAPLDALARLAAAAGYEARGERVTAEHHLGMALSILSRGGESPDVTVAEAEGLLRLIAAIARGTPKPAPAQPAPRRCGGRVVGPHGMIERCGRPAEDGADLCVPCARRHPRI